MSEQTRKPLEGIKVVELATYVAAPVCGRMLADFGAEVIKIEGFKGDPWRETAKACTFTGDEENPVFDIYNAGKKSIRMNIKTPEGKRLLDEMIAQADIFISHNRTASLVRNGLDYETLHARFPRLICVTINGYGDLGPDAAAPGFDNVAFWTRSGFLMDMSVRSEQSYPVLSPTGSGDTVAGAMLFGGVMTALYNRERTGEGDHVTTALYNNSVWMLASMILQAQDKYGVKFPKTRTMSSPFSSPYRCLDGEWLCITVLDYDRYRDTIFRILGIEEEMAAFDIPTQADLKKQCAAIIPIMERAFAKKTCNEWLKLLKAEDVVCGRLNHMREVSFDEQAIVNQFVQSYRCHDGSECMMPTPPIRLASQEVPLAKGAPLNGEDTLAVLKQFGYDEEAAAVLKASGTI